MLSWDAEDVLRLHDRSSGKPSNGGEQVRLLDDAGSVIVDVTWQMSGPSRDDCKPSRDRGAAMQVA